MKFLRDTIIIWIHESFCNCFSVDPINNCLCFWQAWRAMHFWKMSLINIVLCNFLKHCIDMIFIMMLFTPLRVFSIKTINRRNFKVRLFFKQMMPCPYKSIEFLGRITKSRNFHSFLGNSRIFSNLSTRTIYVPLNAMLRRVNSLSINFATQG